MGLTKRLGQAWSHTLPSGGTLRRTLVLAAWGFGRVGEELTDVLYRRRGLDTRGRDWNLHGAGTELAGYVPTKWRQLPKIFENCQAGPEDVLLEYGSGKGRVLMWAGAHYPFRRAIGVELDENLHVAAEGNLERWRGRLLCGEITLTCQDATQFEVPDDVTVIYFGNPFTGDVFRQVLAKIEASLADRPRPLVILYWHPKMHETLVDAGFSVERRSITHPNQWAIYRHRIAEPVTRLDHPSRVMPAGVGALQS